jgi:hypothetical protein
MTKVVTTSVLAVLTVFSTMTLVACEDDDVGVPCASGGSGTQGRTVTTNATDCLSRICIRWTGNADPQCTKVCESNDDCPSTSDYCSRGFRCIVGRDFGSLRCCKMCICEDNMTPDEIDGKSSNDCDNYTPNCPKL